MQLLQQKMYCGHTQPKNKEELINETNAFWDTVDVYIINHLNKVLPKVIEVGDEPTGY